MSYEVMDIEGETFFYYIGIPERREVMRNAKAVITTICLAVALSASTALAAPKTPKQRGKEPPVGTVLAFAGAQDRIPGGYLLCDGRDVSRTTFADLFAVIGVTHGDGNITETFNLPDYRGRFLRGVDFSSTTGVSGLDPEADLRDRMNDNGNVGNNVGSVQGDATAPPPYRRSISGSRSRPKVFTRMLYSSP